MERPLLKVLLAVLLWSGTIPILQAEPAEYWYYTYASYQFNTLKHPSGLAMAGFNELYIADTDNHVIRKFSNGQLSVLAGAVGVAGYVNGTLPSARFNTPTGLSGGKYSWIEWVEDPGCDGGEGPQGQGPDAPPCGWGQTQYYTALNVNDTNNYAVRMICSGYPRETGSCNQQTAETVSTAAGPPPPSRIRSYQNGSNSNAQFAEVAGLTEGFFIADAGNHKIRQWDGSTVTDFAGTGQVGLINGYRTDASFNTPTKLARDSSGNSYVADMGNHVIRKIDSAGNVTTFAGTGEPGYVNGSGSVAQFNEPSSIVFNAADGYLYVTDSGNQTIRRITLSGTVSTYAGADSPGLVNGNRTGARFSRPLDLLISGGFMYIADSLNNVVRRIDMATGVVSTYVS